MSKRYEWKEIEDGYSTRVVIWDNLMNTKVNFLKGDVLDYLNTMHEQSKMIEELSACIIIEQRAGMELARKIIDLIK